MTFRTSNTLSAVFLVLATAATFSQVPEQRLDLTQADTKACMKCHGMSNLAFRDSIDFHVRNFSVTPAVYTTSVHGKVECRDCHDEIVAYPHVFTGPRVKVGCGDDCHAKDKTGGTYTHKKIAQEFRGSVHGNSRAKGMFDGPTCLTCHGNNDAHGVQRAMHAITAKAKIDLCITCHDNEALMTKNHVNTEAVTSYQRSFHYKAIKFGKTNTAVCQDCHTVHHVLPGKDTASSIAPGNVAQTCGQQNCHPGAKMNFAMSGANHLSMRIEKEPFLWFEENFFLALTAGTLVMLLSGIFLDIQKKFGWLSVIKRAVLSMADGLRPVGKISLGAGRLLKKLLID